MQTDRECFCVSSRVWPRSFPECECCWFVPRSWGTRGHSCFCQRCSSADPWLPPTEHTQKLIKTKYKAGFLKSFNSIFGKIGRSTSEEVLFELIKSKWLPILLYSTNVCPMNSAGRHSLQFTINNIEYKIFGAMSKDLYKCTLWHWVCRKFDCWSPKSFYQQIWRNRQLFISYVALTGSFVWLYFFYLLRLFNFCLINFFIYIVLPHTMVK